MLVIRPISADDLPALVAMSHTTGHGLTTIPRDESLLKKKIRASLRGFAALGDDDPPRGECYLFALVDLSTDRLAGVSGIVSKVGGFVPFYGYRLETETVASKQLDVRKTIQTLHLVQQHDGPCEIGSLFLSHANRGSGAGRLLSLSRFLFMADHPDYFDPVVISELRGVTDEAGRSPFWDAVGHHFFDVEFSSADRLSTVDKKFIAELMPKHPLYVPLLPYSAQAAIGKVQPDTEPALAVLRGEGFTPNDMVDIFDAGPVVQCSLRRIRTIHRSKIGTVRIGTTEGAVYLVGNRRQDFRAVMTPLVEHEGTVRIDHSAAAALGVSDGQLIRYVPLRPEPEGPNHDAPGAI